MRVLVTRPGHQQSYFVTGVRNLGLTPVCLPTIDILPTDVDIDLEVIRAAGFVLFTSRNAVEFAHLINPLPWNTNNILSIGPATATALNNHNQALMSKPIEPYTSEAFLNDFEQTMSVAESHTKRAVIIKGEGGRQLLEESLHDKGIELTTYSVYRRLCPAVPSATVIDIFGDGNVDIIASTSDDGLINLLQIAGMDYRDTVLNAQLIVNSERASNTALKLGFKKPPLVANPPGDKGQLQALQNYLNQHT
ncbi:MAG: uroporphyrinogen-III synthase [Gammaproteobacteria bacterium]|nr:uroporphyrinogen-III synthase [Gammaproteobacteria bacterium]